MPKSEAGPLLRFIRAMRLPGAGPEDAALLERYLAQRDESAFELLMWRHAATVLHVCQDVLQDAFAAEDAFQATFLVLARKANSIGRRESLSAWLYRVALRIAWKARKKKVSQSVHELDGMDRITAQVPCAMVEESIPAEWRPLLHDELARLPAKYQIPMVLCYLEGKTHEQAAAELGWPKGTVAGRLARARDLLRRRLTRRGLTLSAGLTFLLAEPALGAVPPALAKSTCKAALAFAAGKLTGVSPQVALWAEGAVRTMLMWKIKCAAIVLIALTVVGSGAGTVVYSVVGATAGDDEGPAAVRQNDSKLPKAGAPVERKKPRNILLVTRHEGVVQLVGTEIKPGENVQPERLIRFQLGKETRSYKALYEGDEIKAGDLLVKLDDRLAVNKMEIARAKVSIAKSEAEGAYKTFLEAQERYRVAEALFRRNPPLVQAEEFREKKLARDKFQSEAEAKKAQIGVAEAELRNAEIILQMHEIRSPVAGTIRSILKGPGEGVKALEAVIEIVPKQKKQ